MRYKASQTPERHFYRLQYSTTPQHTPTDSLSDRLPDAMDPLSGTVTYHGTHVRASECRLNTAFSKSDPVLTTTSTALLLSSAVTVVKKSLKQNVQHVLVS
ncbi:hypothetical protein TNCV_313031 [Trichonephila clavipes]|nr:hypothetical protein TNCV_313031 [Trichonephila clavipes]